MALTRFIAGLSDTTRVFCRGEVRLEKGWFPAVLTYNPIYKQTLAWAASGRKDAMEGHHEGVFWSGIPHQSIAREVLDTGGTMRTVFVAQGIEAGTGETQSGLIHESPVGATDAPNAFEEPSHDA